MDTPIPPLARRDFGINAVRLGRRWRQAVDTELRRYGLTASTWRPLFYLGELGDGVRPKDLAEALDMERPSLGQLIDRLEAEGLVERRATTDDRRGKTIHLTAAGREIHGRTVEVALMVSHKLTAHISDDEINACLSVFSRIRQAADTLEDDQP